MRDFELEKFFSQWEFRARYHMTASDLESLSIRDLLDMAGDGAREAFENTWLGYTETWGAPELRAAIAGTYDKVGDKDILTFVGANEGIYATMRVLLEPADHVIAVVPNYQSSETVPLSICDVSGVLLHEENDWRLDIDEVRAAIRPSTRLIAINFPNNPTGAVPPREDLDALIDLCREQGIYLFSDEVYRLVELDDDDRLPQVADAYEKGISLNVMSKAYGLPGLRVGWIATQDRELLQRVERYKHYLSICTPAPSEQLAILALRNSERILARNRALVRDNFDALCGFLARHENLFAWTPPKGGCVGFVRYLGDDGVESFCRELVEAHGVLLLPASIYRSELMEFAPPNFRIGFGRGQVFTEGLAALEAAITT